MSTIILIKKSFNLIIKRRIPLTQKKRIQISALISINFSFRSCFLSPFFNKIFPFNKVKLQKPFAIVFFSPVFSFFFFLLFLNRKNENMSDYIVLKNLFLKKIFQKTSFFGTEKRCFICFFFKKKHVNLHHFFFSLFFFLGNGVPKSPSHGYESGQFDTSKPATWKALCLLRLPSENT